MLSEERFPSFTVALAPYPNPGDGLMEERPTPFVNGKGSPQPITTALYHRDHLEEILISSIACLFNTQLDAFFLKLTHALPIKDSSAREIL